MERDEKNTEEAAIKLGQTTVANFGFLFYSVIIGDRLETDILGGKLAGLGATFWIPLRSADHATLDDDYEAPDFTIESVMELADHFLTIENR